MSGDYKIYGIELSPYSVKVRSYFRYKQIPHEWIVRRMDRMPEFKRHAKLPLVPLVVTPEDEGVQDSSPIIERMEAKFPEPSIYPDDPVSRFVSALIEEYADEWVNKPMFHFRWSYEDDQRFAALAIARDAAPKDAPDSLVEGMADQVRKRMIPRVSFVGSSESTRAIIEDSYDRQLEILQAHLRDRPYLFGKRPAYADFAYAGQMYQLQMDPTPGALMRAEAPAVGEWVERMLQPQDEGEFEPWSALEPTLRPLLEQEIAGCFLPWTRANAAAIDEGNDTMHAQLRDGSFEQKPQKYHAKSFAVLKQKRAEEKSAELDALLQYTGCGDYL